MNIGGNKAAEMLAGDIARDILGMGRTYTPRVNMGNLDKTFFEQNIIRANMNDSTPATIASHKRIKGAYYKIQHFIDDSLNSKSTYMEKVELLCNLYDTFAKKFKVMSISTTDLEEAFVFFETLNARGKDLETSDLLKNHLFKNCTSKLSTIEKKWDNMIDALDGNEPTKYIRTFWNSKYDHIREKQLYKEIRSKINSAVICMNFTDDLVEYAPYYRVLVNPQTNSNEFQNNEIINVLEDLKTLKAKTFYPLVLAMIERKFTEDDILITLKAIATVVFRNFTICRENPSSFERTYSGLAHKVFNQEIKTADELREELNSLTVEDETFEASFKYESITASVARFILCKIENNQRCETQMLKNNNKIHIEHIMPQSKTHWSQIDDDTHKKYLNTIGNLTLLGSKLNVEASNKTFVEKRDSYYSQSEITITKSLCDYDDWNSSQIIHRAEELLDEAEKFWN